MSPETKPRSCVDCGVTLEILGIRCEPCLKANWWRETIARQGRALAENADIPVTLVTDTRMQRHVALLNLPDTGFCGMTGLPSKESKRRSMPLKELPATICPACREVLDRALEAARP